MVQVLVLKWTGVGNSLEPVHSPYHDTGSYRTVHSQMVTYANRSTTANTITQHDLSARLNMLSTASVRKVVGSNPAHLPQSKHCTHHDTSHSPLQEATICRSFWS